MQIFISSLGRPDKQLTLEYISERLREYTRIVVVPDEYKAYAKNFGEKMLIKLPKAIKGLSAQRQWLLEEAEDRDVVFLDDDLQFDVRSEGVKLRRCDKSDFEELIFTWMEWIHDGYPLVGVSMRNGNNRCEGEYEEIGRIMSAYAFDRDVLIKEGISFNRVPVMQDLDVTLELLKLGYPNRISYRFAHSQAGGSGATGGCSTYRNSEMIRETAYRMTQLHPRIVRVAAKVSKTAWGNMEKKKGIDGTVRTDVNIQWKVAYRPKKKLQPTGILNFLGDKK